MAKLIHQTHNQPTEILKKQHIEKLTVKSKFTSTIPLASNQRFRKTYFEKKFRSNTFCYGQNRTSKSFTEKSESKNATSLKNPPSSDAFTVQYNSSKVTTQRNNGNSSELNTVTLSNHSKNRVLLSENPQGIMQSQKFSFNAKSPKTPQDETDNFKTKMRRYQELQRKVNDLSYQMPSSDYDEDDSAMPQLKADLEQFFKA